MPTFTWNDLTFIHVPKTAGTSITKWFEDNLGLKLVPGNQPHASSNDPNTFAVVRNPWDRVVSMYFFLQTRNKFFQMLRPSFEDFVKTPEKYPAPFIQPTRTQKSYIPNGVKYLLRFENLQEDFKVIQDLTGCQKPLEVIRKTAHNDYKTYYTDETRAIIAERFKDDISEFNYTF